MSFALLGPLDLIALILVILFCTFVLIRGQRSVHVKLGSVEATINDVKATSLEVAHAVNNVQPDEPKLIDQVRSISATQDSMLLAQNDLARIGHANHIAVVSVETTVLGFGERLTAIGMKADQATKRAEAAHKIVSDYIYEQNIIDDAVRRGLIDRRALHQPPEE